MKEGRLDRVLTSWDPELEIEQVDWPVRATFRGYDGYRRWFTDAFASFDNVRCDPEDLIPAGDRVVVPVKISGDDHSNGVHLEVSVVLVHELRDGRILRQRIYSDRARALREAGVPE